MPQASRYIRVVNRDRSRGRPAVRGTSQNPERQIMTLGCEIKTNLRPESRFSPDDITRFGDPDDRAAVAEFAARFCNYFDSYMQRHGKGHGMRVKRDPRCTSGYSTALWTIERDSSIRKDKPRQVSMKVVSPTMAYDMTQWRDAVKSMYRSVGDRYLFEANVSYHRKTTRKFPTEPSLPKLQITIFQLWNSGCKDFVLKIPIDYRKAAGYTSISSPPSAGI